ncbi:hypothetical protein [Aeromonas caviae]|uniref:hypothetical protein n=1 Tax=Aeromonas caviae TaxID=648 RepID=UPI002B47A98B|nr:hypothetical protein [Aeromonas caviae]
MVNNRLHSTLKKILNPNVKMIHRKDTIISNFNFFIAKSPIDNVYEDVLKQLLKNSYIRSSLNFYVSKHDDFGSKGYFGVTSVSVDRMAILYKTIINQEHLKLKSFELHKQAISQLIIQGRYLQAKEKLLTYDREVCPSLWSISVLAKIEVLNKSSEPHADWLKTTNSLSLRHYAISYEKQIAVDASTYLDNKIRRHNREFFNAKAYQLAAFNALLHLPYPLYEQANSIFAFHSIQNLPLLDFYESLSEIFAQHYNDDASSIITPPLEDIRKDIITNTNLNGFKVLSNALTPYSQSVLNRYNNGDYISIIDELEGNFGTLDSMASNLNIYAKSYIYSSRVPTKNLPSILLSSITQLINIYLLKNTNTAIQQLISTASRLAPIQEYKHILISILKAAPYYFDEHTRNKIASSANFLIERATPLDSKDFLPPYFQENDTVNRCTGENLILKNSILKKIHEKTNQYHDIESDIYAYRESTPIFKDYVELMVFYLNTLNDNARLLKFTAQTLIDSPQSYICFPLNELIEYISAEEIFTIEAVIAVYIYNVNSKRKLQETFNDTYEAYFLESGLNRFSDMFESRESMTDMEIFLLKKISTSENMDYLGIFDDEIDLTLERIKIITQLNSLNYIDRDSFEKEFTELVDNVVIGSGAAKLTSAKIFVDTDSIYRQNKSEIDSLIATHKRTSNEVNDYQSEPFQSKDALPDEVEDVDSLAKISLILRREFINNPDAGLDKILSSEIRHGFFGNLMCSKLQERKILCELDENGNYVNKHWVDYYHIVHKDIMSQVHDQLKKFTENFNRLIEEAEGWMKTTITSEPGIIFNFQYNNWDNMILSHNLRNEGVDNYIQSVFTILNDKLLINLNSMKGTLNTTLSNRIDAIFNNLIKGITDKKRNASLTDLMEQIKTAQYETKESIKTACEWFNFKKDISFEPFPVEHLIKLATRCYSQISPTTISFIHGNLSEQIRNVPGSHISAMVQTLINCFNNALKHGSERDKIFISSAYHSPDSYSIYVKNTISKHKEDELNKGALARINDTLSNMDSNELLIKEGGTGLYKSKYELLKCDPNYNISLCCENGLFIAEIRYGK